MMKRYLYQFTMAFLTSYKRSADSAIDDFIK